MRYMSVCSGVEAASLAWEPLGWEPFAFSEVEPFPCAVLAARWPNVPNLGDMTRIRVGEDGGIEYGADGFVRNDGRSVDLLVGGTPCQDASLSGKRAGLIEGEKSVLAFTYARLAYELAAYRGLRWICWENVPGVFSLNSGLDFAAFLSSLVGRKIDPPDRGWGNFGIVPQSGDGNFGVAWRVLDCQYARVDGFPRAVPQRRRRCFLAGYLGDWRRAAEVLFEPKAVLGNTPPRRYSGQEPSEGDPGRAEEAVWAGSGRTGPIVLDMQGGKIGCHFTRDGACPTLTRGRGSIGDVHSILVPAASRRTAVSFEPGIAKREGNSSRFADGVSSTLRASMGDNQTAVCVSGGSSDGVVRRLTPVENERLMGFPDNHTVPEFAGITDDLVDRFVDVFYEWGRMNAKDGRTPKRKSAAVVRKWLEEVSGMGTCPDSSRYRACGNSMAVNCMRWIGKRIDSMSFGL